MTLAAERLATDPAWAEAQARLVLKAAPNDPLAGLLLASARRRQGDAPSALAILERLAATYPGAVHTHYELGLARAALGATLTAIQALQHALYLKPDLAEGWHALGQQLFLQGDSEGSERAYAQHRRTVIRDPLLRPAADAIFEGRYAEAEQRLVAHLKQRSDDATAIRLLADVYVQQGNLSDAESLLAVSLEIDPEFEGARFNYANVLFLQQKGVAALPHIESLLEKAPKNPAYLNLVAGCAALLGEADRVIAIYEQMLADYGRHARIWLNYGHALRTAGRGDDAAIAYRKAIALAPGLGDAYWSLANLKTAQFSALEEGAMVRRLADASLSEEDRLHLHYALGKALEDKSEYEGAFGHFAKGAAIRRSQTRYSRVENAEFTQQAISLTTKSFFADRCGGGSSSEDPIFIVGLPRSGSTLVEQILASHSAVEGTMELPDVGFAVQSIRQSPRFASALSYTQRLQTLPLEDFVFLGDRYIENTRIYRKSRRPIFIDKMPNNFQHIGLIHLMLPNAKIVDVRRHPMAAGFAAFKQNFAQGQTFSYDLNDLGLYYRDYIDLMAHIDLALPGRVHRVIYEKLVENTETEVRRLLDYCGLPFEDSCLRFYENRRSVRTVSSEQVRRPIYREGLHHWRHFEPWLGPLQEALGAALDGWRR